MPERDERGRFVKGGYKGGPGRPPRQVETDYMAITIGQVTPEYWQAITKRAIHDAIKGDRDARRWLSDYVLGKPPAIVELRAADAQLLAQLLEAFKARGVQASDVFNAMLAQLATADTEEGDDGRR